MKPAWAGGVGWGGGGGGGWGGVLGAGERRVIQLVITSKGTRVASRLTSIPACSPCSLGSALVTLFGSFNNPLKFLDLVHFCQFVFHNSLFVLFHVSVLSLCEVLGDFICYFIFIDNLCVEKKSP